MRFFIILLFVVSFLNAHSLKIFSSKEKDFLHVKAYFSASSPCRECDVNVESFDGKISKYKTDKKGIIQIPLNLNPIKVVVDGGLGHQNTINISPAPQANKPFKLPFWAKIILSLIFILSFFLILGKLKRK